MRESGRVEVKIKHKPNILFICNTICNTISDN